MPGTTDLKIAILIIFRDLYTMLIKIDFLRTICDLGHLQFVGSRRQQLDAAQRRSSQQAIDLRVFPRHQAVVEGAPRREFSGSACVGCEKCRRKLTTGKMRDRGFLFPVFVCSSHDSWSHIFEEIYSMMWLNFYFGWMKRLKKFTRIAQR